MNYAELSKAIEESKETLSFSEGVNLAAQILFPKAFEQGFNAKISSTPLKATKRFRLDITTRRSIRQRNVV